MSQHQIAGRYAKALFDLAETENVLYPVYVSLREITALIKDNADMKVFIHNPLLSAEEKEHVIRKVFENRIPELLFKFLLFLNVKGRLALLVPITEAFDLLHLEKNSQVRVTLQTPYALDDQQADAIRAKLSQRYKREVSLESHVKPELLGGFRLFAEGYLYDGSIKTQLEQFRQKVLA